MKKVLVTGASGGIGMAICKYYLNHNYEVIYHYNSSQNKLKELRLMHIKGKRDQVNGCSTCTVLHDVPRQSDLDGVSDHLSSVYSKMCPAPIG